MRNNSEESIGCLILLKLFIRKLQRVLFHSSASKGQPSLNEVKSFDDEMEAAKYVPEDIKKGYFAVTAAEGGEQKRFVVELDYLTNPAFLTLLEKAKNEYGFQQKGVLEVPCRPEELQKILNNRRRRTTTEW